MFKISYDENLLVQESNPFMLCKQSKEKLEINTRHVFIGMVQFPNGLPIDFLYRKENGVELLFLVYSTNTPKPKRLLFDGGQNGVITLESPTEQLTSMNSNEVGYHYDYQYFFPMTKDQLNHFCFCNEINISIDDIAKKSYDNKECSEFVFMCKMMYREILYRLSFHEIDEYMSKKKEEMQTTSNQKEESQNNK